MIRCIDCSLAIGDIVGRFCALSGAEIAFVRREHECDEFRQATDELLAARNYYETGDSTE